MSVPLFAIRPEPGLSETLAAGAQLGLDIHGESLFAVERVDWDPVDPERVDGLLAGSANAFRLGGKGLQALSGKPVYAVGAKTAEAARAAGFAVAATGEGGLQKLLGELKGPLRLFRPTGEERVILDPPGGVLLEERTVYRAVAMPLPESLAKLLKRGGIVLLHSAAAGHHFAAECERLAIARDNLALAAIGPRVLGKAGAGWNWTAAAPEPSDTALLALARDMCLSGDGSKNGR